MKILLPLLFFASLSCNAASMTITHGEIVGTWISYEGFNDAQRNINPAGKLIITEEFNMEYTQKGKSSRRTASGVNITTSNDMLIIPLELNNKLVSLLVISGWINGNEKYMFGTLYTYNSNGQIFFGTPISFRPGADNKSFEADAETLSGASR